MFEPSVLPLERIGGAMRSGLRKACLLAPPHAGFTSRFPLLEATPKARSGASKTGLDVALWTSIWRIRFQW